jgi:protoporphyrin/coproporphyrin ferrochelatase
MAMAWFQGTSGQTESIATVGVLLVNLGTPESPDYGPIRRYLGAFLGDRRVVEACPAYWYPILYGPILTFRPLRTAKLYRAVWTDQGSPLLVYSKQLANSLQRELGERGPVRVDLGMTYGEPSVAAAIERLQAAGIRKLIVLPLYPQYSGSTTGAVFDVVTKALRRWRRVPELRFIADYHDEPAYIEALAARIRAVWAEEGRSHLVLSNHGIPVKYVELGDPYREQVERTTALLVETLGLSASDYSLVFQSRFGPTTWLQPYTDDRLQELAASGVRAVTVVTPSFAVDCLETLEEIAVASREKFLAAGGERFTLVPALNDSSEHVAALAAVLRRAGLPEAAG